MTYFNEDTLTITADPQFLEQALADEIMESYDCLEDVLDALLDEAFPEDE